MPEQTQPHTIQILFKKKTTSKYTFSITQDEKLLNKRDCNVSNPNDVDLYSAFTEFLNRQVQLEIADNNAFKFKNIADFKAWANASMQNKFLAEYESE